MKSSTLLTAFALTACEITQVLAHGGVLSYNIGGQIYQGFKSYNTPVGQSTIQREWDSYDPIIDPMHPQISCNLNGANLGSGQLSATVAAGSKVLAWWNQWPHNLGPVMVYMANCNGPCTAANTASLNWFKIEEAGLISGTVDKGTWAQGQLIANNNSWTTTIPASLAPGEYMLRHELLSIHTPNQPQFYPNCAQLKLTGGGSAQPSGSYLVKLPGAYKASDPGVTLDVYNHPTWTNYTIPGPAVWRG